MLAMLLPVAVAMLLAWAGAVFLYSSALERRATAQLANAAEILARGNLPLSPDLLARLGELQGAEYLLANHGGIIVYSTWEPVPAELRGLPRVAADQRVTIAAVPWIVVARDLRNNQDSRYAWVIAATSLADTRVAARRAALALAGVLLLALVVLSLILRRLVHGVTEPLSQLAAAAHDIAAGRRDVRVKVRRDDEVGRLGAALNNMSARLSEYEKALAERSRNAALGELSARIAHEIRNPLTGIKMHLQLLAESNSDDRPRIEQLLAEVRRLELIANATLALGRDAALQLERLDLSALARDVSELMTPAFAHRGIALELHAPAPVPLTADGAQLRQALLNLLVNAADAMPGGGRIRVSVAMHDDRARLVVEDSGPGINAAPPSGKSLGLGLGLPLCREIVARHQGELRTSASEALAGACFTIEMPVATAAI